MQSSLYRPGRYKTWRNVSTANPFTCYNWWRMWGSCTSTGSYTWMFYAPPKSDDSASCKSDQQCRPRAKGECKRSRGYGYLHKASVWPMVLDLIPSNLIRFRIIFNQRFRVNIRPQASPTTPSGAGVFRAWLGEVLQCISISVNHGRGNRAEVAQYGADLNRIELNSEPNQVEFGQT